MTINYLRAQAHTLQQQLAHAPVNSVQWHNLQNHLLVVRAQLREAEGGLRNLTF